MALPTLYPVDFLSDLLCTAGTVSVWLERYDEEHTSGAGQRWTAQLAPPKWRVDIDIPARRRDDARMIDSRIRSLGSNGVMLFEDKCYRGPAADKGGAVLGSASPTIYAVSTDRKSIRIQGLPVGYSLQSGDRISVSWGGGRKFFTETIEGAVASGAGITPSFEVYPFAPLGVTVGAAVELVRPTMRMQVYSHTPFSERPGRFGFGARVSLIEKP